MTDLCNNEDLVEVKNAFHDMADSVDGVGCRTRQKVRSVEVTLYSDAGNVKFDVCLTSDSLTEALPFGRVMRLVLYASCS